MAEWGVVFVIAYQGLAIAYMFYEIRQERKQWDAERKDLLNRIMVKDYPTYVNGEVVMENAKKHDQIYAEQEEQGIPVI